jgi:hypothetical protein
MKRLALVLALVSTVAVAQEPTEAEKKSALLRAYHFNGDSMVGWGSIELPPLPTLMHPVEIWTDKNPLDAVADQPPRRVAADICALHGMRKVVSPDGLNWRCRK